MKLDIAIHTHKHGVDVFPFFRDDGDELPDENVVINKINEVSDFDPSNDETWDWALVDINVPLKIVSEK